MTTAQRIDTLLKAKKLSRRQAALMAGIPPSSFQSAMQRDGNMSIDMLKKISQLLQCDISELVDQKQGPRLIIDQLIDTYTSPDELSPYDEELLFDALEEECGADGTLSIQYARFVTEHAQLMSLIEKQGYVLNLVNWRMVEISHPKSTSIRVSITEVLGFLKVLSGSFDDTIQDVFREIGVNSDETKQED